MHSRQKRKFHDLWAFAVFIISTISTNALMSIHEKIQIKSLYSSAVNTAMIYSAAFVFLFTIFVFLGFYLVPKIILHCGFIFSILLAVILPIMAGNIFFVFLGLLFAGITCYFYIVYGLKYIPLSAVILKATTILLLRQALPLLLFNTTLIVLLSGQLLLFLLVLPIIDPRTEYPFLFCLLQVFWAVAVSFYLSTVFVANLISFFLFEEGRGSNPVEGLKNTFFSFGTICLGGLLVAVIKLLRYIVSSNERRDRRENNNNLLMIIFYFITNLLLSLLESIVLMANDWAFVYVAIYGKNYFSSVKESFEKIMQDNNHLLVNNIVVDKGLWFVSIAGLLIYSIFLGKSFGEVGVLVLVCMVVFYVTLVMSCFSAATKTILFVYAERRSCVENVLPEVDLEIKEMQRKEMA